MTLLLDAVPFLRRYSDARGAFAGVFLSEELKTVIGTEDWPLVHDAIVECAIQHEATTPIGQLVPAIGAVSGESVLTAPLRRRSQTTLSRARVSRWGELLPMTPEDLLKVPGAGALTARDIMGTCLDLAVTAVAAGVIRPSSVDQAGDSDRPAGLMESEGVSDERSSALMVATRAAQLVAAWATRERRVTRMADVLPLDPTPSLPPDIAEAVRAFGELDPRDLAPRAATSADLNDLASRLLGLLDTSHRHVFQRRVLDDKATLELVGEEMGITRERVRQLQVSAERSVSLALRSDEFRVLHWRAWDLGVALGRAAPIGHPATENAIGRALRGCGDEAQRILHPLLLRLAGPYRERDGWLFRSDLPVLSPKDLASLADRHGLLSVQTAKAWLTEAGVLPELQDEWLEASGRFRRHDETLLIWSGGAVGKCVALLALHGKPMDAETLVGLVGEGHAYRGVRNGFLEDPRLMRVSRSLWGLRDWGLEEYSGIAEEIAQRIQERGGRAKVQQLVDELVPLFGVRENSVRTYAQAPMFVQEHGWVRLRRDDEPFEVSTDIAGSRGVFAHDRGVSVLLTVDTDMLRGSGRAFPSAAAAALGIPPGQRRAFTHALGTLLVSWPTSSCMGPTMGSTRSIADGATAQVGSYLRLTFDDTSGSVLGVRTTAADLAAMRTSDAVAALTGISEMEAPDAALATALGVPVNVVRRVLLDRGDTVVAGLLPNARSDDGLEEALGELIDLLDAGS